MTRGPAKPMSARGSARFRSPSSARLADTPPVVGSVSTEMKGRCACARRARADAHVVTALGADIEVALELGAIEHRIAGRALDPQSLRDRARAPLGLDAGGHDLVEPGHS